VTGAARGIGQAIALRLARSGHALALGDLHPADETVTAIRNMKEAGGAFAVECDLGSPGGVALLVGEVTSRLGRCDVLVNCAGLMLFRPFGELNLETWRIHTEEHFEEVRRAQAVSWYIEPRDLAGAVPAHLPCPSMASDEAAMISGQTLRIDGGLVTL
jgi:NAD(P)-dependent dehydrogenase (short-subunit alcohol dehydrogenase family)